MTGCYGWRLLGLLLKLPHCSWTGSKHRFGINVSMLHPSLRLQRTIPIKMNTNKTNKVSCSHWGHHRNVIIENISMDCDIILLPNCTGMSLRGQCLQLREPITDKEWSLDLYTGGLKIKYPTGQPPFSFSGPLGCGGMLSLQPSVTLLTAHVS